jgi:hypothetical protein
MLECRIVGIGFSIVKYGDLCLREAMVYNCCFQKTSPSSHLSPELTLQVRSPGKCQKLVCLSVFRLIVFSSILFFRDSHRSVETNGQISPFRGNFPPAPAIVTC